SVSDWSCRSATGFGRNTVPAPMLEPDPPAATAAPTATAAIPIDANNILARTTPSIRCARRSSGETRADHRRTQSSLRAGVALRRQVRAHLTPSAIGKAANPLAHELDAFVI